MQVFHLRRQQVGDARIDGIRSGTAPFQDHIIDGVNYVYVITGTAFHGISACTAVVEIVISGLPLNGVIAGATIYDVIIAFAAVQRLLGIVIGNKTQNHIVAFVSIQRVIADVSEYSVVTGATKDDVSVGLSAGQ